MKTFTEPNAYDTIQADIESNFNLYIHKSRESIKNIVIVGAHWGLEIGRMLSVYPNATFHAFEAHPLHYQRLVSTFNNHARVKCYNYIVTNFIGQSEFYELTNDGGGCGSVLEFQGDKFGHHFKIKEKLILPTITLKSILDIDIDMLWVDVQGAELLVLQGADLTKCKSLFLEVNTRDFIAAWDKEPYKGQVFIEELESYLSDFTLHSIGLDNASGNGQGNGFWIRK